MAGKKIEDNKGKIWLRTHYRCSWNLSACWGKSLQKTDLFQNFQIFQSKQAHKSRQIFLPGSDEYCKGPVGTTQSAIWPQTLRNCCFWRRKICLYCSLFHHDEFKGLRAEIKTNLRIWDKWNTRATWEMWWHVSHIGIVINSLLKNFE